VHHICSTAVRCVRTAFQASRNKSRAGVHSHQPKSLVSADSRCRRVAAARGHRGEAPGRAALVSWKRVGVSPRQIALPALDFASERLGLSRPVVVVQGLLGSRVRLCRYSSSFLGRLQAKERRLARFKSISKVTWQIAVARIAAHFRSSAECAVLARAAAKSTQTWCCTLARRPPPRAVLAARHRCWTRPRRRA